MSDTTRRRFLTIAGTGAVAAIAGCGSNAPDEEGAGDTTTTATTEETTTEDGDTTTTTTTEADGEEEETTTEGNYTGGTLRMASIGAVQTLDPVNAKGSGAGYDQYQESLLEFPDGDLPPQPRLATDIEVSGDGRTYTVSLKEGVSFHDGTELTASDVVYSWERLAQSENSRNRDDIIGGTFTIAHEKEGGDELENYVPGSLAVEAVDDYTFEFTTAEAFHGTFSQIAGGAFGIIPENSVGDIEREDVETEGEYEYNEFFGTAGDGPTFVATGPFTVESWSKGDQIELARFEDYHGEGPYIDAITYTVLSSAGAEYSRALNGNLDIFSVPTPKFDPDSRSIEDDQGSYRTGTYELENGETVNYGEATALDTDYILFNCDRTERPFRRAIAYMINQHDIAESIFKGLGTPGYALTPPPVFPAGEGEEPTEMYDRFVREGANANFVPEEFGTDGYPYGYDEARIPEARRVMEEAGYNSDDMYEAKFTVFSGSPSWDQISKRIRDKARAAHIDITITKADFGTIIGKAVEGTMDFFSLGDGMEWPESDNFLRFLHPTATSPMFTRWNPPEEEWNPFQQAAEDAWQSYTQHKGPGEENQRARNEAYITIEQMNWASVQELPLLHGVTQRYWYPRVNERMAGTMEDQTHNTLTLEDTQ